MRAALLGAVRLSGAVFDRGGRLKGERGWRGGMFVIEACYVDVWVECMVAWVCFSDNSGKLSCATLCLEDSGELSLDVRARRGVFCWHGSKVAYAQKRCRCKDGKPDSKAF